MDECCKCQRKEDEVKLVDAVFGREIVKICEECAISEQVPILRLPDSAQINASQKARTVHERLSRMAGLPVQPVREEIKPRITLDKLRPAKDYSKIIQEKLDKAKKDNQPSNLIDNYNWHIQMARRARKLTLAQLSNIIGESEIVLKMVENGQTFDDILRVIAKLEQFFKIKLRKSEEVKEQERVQEAVKSIHEPARILNFDPESLKNITLADLKRIKDEREKSERDDWQKAGRMAWRSMPKNEKIQKSMLEEGEIEIIEEDTE